VPRRFGAFVPIPEPQLNQLRNVGSKAGRKRPASTPVLAPGSALGVLLSRALSSAQAKRDCRYHRVRRQALAEAAWLRQTRHRPKLCHRRARLRNLPAWLLAEIK
jgi:hypothetical protein